MRRKTVLVMMMVMGLSISAALGGCGVSGGNQQKSDSTTEAIEAVSRDEDSESSTVEVVGDAETEDIDTSTELVDGEYILKDESFTWSGGTGKVHITCESITVEDGQSWANLTFDSSHYGYVKADQGVYYTTKSGKSASVRIPIRMNVNNHIYAMTDAMSAPHEIAYTIFAGMEDGTHSGMGIRTTAGEQYETLDTEAPEIVSLIFDKEVDLGDSSLLKAYQYQNGYTLVEVMRTDSIAEKEDASSDESPDVKKAALYGNQVVKYLIVPADAEIPAGLDTKVVIIQKPADHVFLASDPVKDAIKKAAGEETEFLEGNAEEIDLKTLITNKITLAVVPGDMNQDTLETLGERAVQMDMAVFVDESSQDSASGSWEKVWQIIWNR